MISYNVNFYVLIIDYYRWYFNVEFMHTTKIKLNKLISDIRAVVFQ